MKRLIPVQEDIQEENNRIAGAIRKILDRKKILGLNIMASPGAGKTSLIVQTINHFKEKVGIAVIEGDIVPIDVDTIRRLGVPVVLAQTGGACHLDATLMQRALDKLPLDSVKLLIVENVGNLVCPAHFPLGTHYNVVVASVPEGDDKPIKYPTMFRSADAVILNKCDYLADDPEFKIDNFMHSLTLCAPSSQSFQVSCRNKTGLNRWFEWIQEQLLQ